MCLHWKPVLNDDDTITWVRPTPSSTPSAAEPFSESARNHDHVDESAEIKEFYRVHGNKGVVPVTSTTPPEFGGPPALRSSQTRTEPNSGSLRSTQSDGITEIIVDPTWFDWLHDELRPVYTPRALRLREGDQPLPVANRHPYVKDLVMEDLRQRAELGKKRYGAYLQPHNGRSVTRDAYEEALDLVMYLRQKLYEEEGK